jgi:amino acid adenylation domain-containing protein
MTKPFDPFSNFELSHTAPSTQSQQEIWLAMQMGGREASLAYNECVSLEIGGPVDSDLLRSAWDAIASRHESLRTCFTRDGQTLCIEKAPRIDWRTKDWSRESPGAQREKRDAFLEEEVSVPFDLVSSPGFRATWADFGNGKSEFILTAHHLVCDGYSAGVLLTELCSVYSALSEGKSPALPPAPRFSDYSLALQEALNGSESADAERYWLKALGESPETLELPTDSPRPAQRTFDARREDILIPRDLLEELKTAAGKMGVSLSAAFQAAFNSLLYRLSGQTEFVIGMPAAGQTLPGFGGLVGHCVNTLPLPVRIAPASPFADYARAVRSVILDGLENQVLSFGGLLQKLRLPRDPSRIPLIPILVNLDPPMKLEKLGATNVRLRSHPRRYEAFEIFLNGTETDEGLILEATYNTALFQRSSILRWIADFQELLLGIIKSPARAVGELPVLSSESRALLQKWNETDRPLPPQATALAMFEAQAAKTPSALAVRDARASLTYRELDERANYIAGKLVGLGISPEDLVGVCVDRSVQTPAALLAVWKAGAAYVPLDPDFPEERLAFIVKDSGVKVLLTETPLVGVFKDENIKRLLLDKEQGASASAPAREAKPEALAYVLFTSGSTGKPKGVQIEQRSIANFLGSMTTDISMSDRDILVAVTTLSFDISGLELYLPLVNGAQTVIASREDALDGQRLSRLLAACSATILQATPATWQLLVEADWKAPRGFKALCGGEALPQDLCKKLLSLVSDLWNVYGPTETTIWSTIEKIGSAEAPISIGKPIGNTTLYIADAGLRQVPIGAAGELLIGGLGVARGYLNRPELDAERFLQDPFAEAPGSRVYRTGDICRFGPDGHVYFQRRNDSQVKVRGFRIELGEIETAIAAHDGVLSAVAAVKDFGSGDARLVGYYVARDEGAVDAAALRAALMNELPRYMVPQYLVGLPKLPLTPNGKVDRKALPFPSGEVAVGADYVEASTPVQKQILSIWCELLRMSKISIKESFFDLGGHSMLAARMLSRIREGLGVEIPMRVVFQAQTIEDLALRVEGIQLTTQKKATVEGGPVERLDF